MQKKPIFFSFQRIYTLLFRRTIYLLVVMAAFISATATAQITIYEDDYQGWINNLDHDTILINFDNIQGSTTNPISGDEFSFRPGNPVITVVDGTGIFVGNPATGQIPNPPSGENMLGPRASGSIEGILKFTFSEPIRALGATFVDVEADFNSTGFSLEMGNLSPNITFTASKGQGSFSFLGFTSESSFSEVEIHFATGSNIDGTLLDDLVYSISMTSSSESALKENGKSVSSVYPNPASANAAIFLHMSEEQNVEIVAFDVYGRKVKFIHDGKLRTGDNFIDLQVSDMANGTYFLKIFGENFSHNHKLVLR